MVNCFHKKVEKLIFDTIGIAYNILYLLFHPRGWINEKKYY